MSQMRQPRYDRKTVLRKNGTLRVQKHFDPEIEPSRTQQHFKEGQDINNIVGRYDKRQFERYLRSGVKFSEQIQDLSDLPDYEQMHQKVASATQAFENLPSVLRNRFQNEPQQLLNFIRDPKNYDEGVSLGLFQPKPTPPPTATPHPPTPTPSKSKKTTTTIIEE